jgi:hypothetical protein
VSVCEIWRSLLFSVGHWRGLRAAGRRPANGQCLTVVRPLGESGISNGVPENMLCVSWTRCGEQLRWELDADRTLTAFRSEWILWMELYYQGTFGMKFWYHGVYRDEDMPLSFGNT